MTTYPQLRDRPAPTEALDRIAEQFRTRAGVVLPVDPDPEEPEERAELEVPELLELPEVDEPEVDEPEVVKAKSKK